MRALFASLLLGCSVVCACAPDALAPLQLQITPSSHLRTQNLVARLDSVQIEVFDADHGARCLDAGAAYSGGRAPLQSLTLRREGCPAGLAFCGEIELERASAHRVFAARGLDEHGALFAQACASVALDRSRVEINLEFVRALPEAVCGDGQLTPPETCESPGQGSCDARCNSAEITLSRAGEGQAMSDVSLLPRAGGLAALYTDNGQGSQDGELSLRAMTDALSAIDTLPESVFLPGAAGAGAAQAGAQRHGRGCAQGDALWIAYEHEQNGQARARLQRVGAGDLHGLGAPIALSADGVDARRPAIACAAQAAFVAWRDEASGRILGRHVGADQQLGPQQDLSGTGDNDHVTLLALRSGWIAAWQSGRSVRLRVLGADGTPSGGAISLPVDNAHSAPQLAALSSGHYALSYLEQLNENEKRVQIQQFDADGRQLGEPITIDQGAQLSAPQLTPLATADDSYAVVYLDDSDVRARYLRADGGFLLNPIDGTEAPFTVSHGAGERAQPTALSLQHGWVVAWHDAAADRGITARLLPLPTR